MLSFENSPIPSSPSKLSEVEKVDDQVSQAVSLEDAVDPQIHEEIPSSNFSIRNFVYESRSKNIQVNWPFARPFLQICLNHGVNSVLPPFESPNLVRAQCLGVLEPEISEPTGNSETVQTLERVELLQPGDVGPSEVILACTADESLSPLALNCSDLILSSSFDDKKSTVEEGIDISKRVCSDDGIIAHAQAEQPLGQTNFLEESGQLAEFGALEPSGNLEKKKSLEKKCRLTVKSVDIPDNIQVDDIASNTCSDTMSSKVCPICKMFTSTSNTTLNAHIDQCLSVKLVANRDSIGSQNVKVKQKKKRLMVDIYTTARHCTLEDLERRNGTNWAVELTSLPVSPASEVVTVSKKPKLMYIEPRDDNNDKEVYVDSNGVKLRILSKSTEMALLREEPEQLKIRMREKANASDLMRENKEFGRKCLKKMKTKVRTKELSTFNVLSSQIEASLEKDSDEENHQISDGSNAGIQVNYFRGSSLGKWVCAKRSVVPRKLASNNPAAQNTLTDSSKPDENTSFSRVSHKKFLRTFDGMTGSPKTKRVEFLCNRNEDLNNRRNYATPACLSSEVPLEITVPRKRLVLKLARLPGTAVSTKSKLDAHERITEVSDRTSQDQTACISKKKELVPLKTWKDKANGEPSGSKMFRKHRANLTRKRIHFGSNVDQEACDNESPSSVIAARSRIVQPCQFNRSSSSAADHVMNQVLPIGRNKPKARRRLLVNMLEEEEDNAECLPFETDCRYGEARTTVNGIGIPNPEHTETEANLELVASEPTSESGEEDMDVGAYIALDAYPRAEELVTSGNEIHSSHVRENLKESSDDKDMPPICVVSHDGIGSNDVEMADEAEASEVKDRLNVRSSECHTNTVSIQETSDCLTSHSNMETEVPNRSASFDSERKIKAHDHNLGKNEEPTASAASIVCLSTSVDTNCINSEEVATEARSLHDNAVSAAESLRTFDMAEERNVEANPEVCDRLPVQENLRLNSNRHFCCSCGENLSRGTQLSRETDIARTSKAKQMFPKLSIGSRTSSSFTAYQSRKTDIAVSSSTGSQNQAVSTKNSFGSPDNNRSHSFINSPGTPSPSNSNSVLRLMGKNLMVVNNDDLVQPQSIAMDYPSARNDVETGLSAACSIPNTAHQHQPLHGSPPLVRAISMGSHHMPLHLPITRVGGFLEPQFSSNWMARTDYQTQPTHIYERNIPSQAPYTTDGMILINGSPELVTDINGCLSSPTSTLSLFTSSLNPFPQRSFSYFPLQSQMREVSTCPQLLNPNFQPGVSPANFVSQGIIKSESQGALRPGHIVFQSPIAGPMGSSGYYPHTML